MIIRQVLLGPRKGQPLPSHRQTKSIESRHLLLICQKSPVISEHAGVNLTPEGHMNVSEYVVGIILTLGRLSMTLIFHMGQYTMALVPPANYTGGK